MNSLNFDIKQVMLNNSFECPLLFKGRKSIADFLNFFDIDLAKIHKKMEKKYSISWIEILFKDWSKFEFYIKSCDEFKSEFITYNDIKLDKILYDFSFDNIKSLESIESIKIRMSIDDIYLAKDEIKGKVMANI